MARDIIRLEGVGKVFDSAKAHVVALEGIDLAIQEGEIFGIIGLSGAGKSTLVRCINLLERPTTGRVIVDDQDMTALPPKALRQARRSIGMIFQQFNLLMQRTALQNICFPMEIAGTPSAEAKKRAEELLGLVGLEDKASAYPAQLSGGQKQRVAIARALATNPKVLLCDEATSALDPTTTRSILALLKEINQRLGITIVVITHEMAVIEEICQRVAIIDQSHIAEIGRVEDIFLRPSSAIARKLIFPDGKPEASFSGNRCLRLVFEGQSIEEPIISGMVLECGAPVSILFADTKHIDGKIYGQMLVQLPDNQKAVFRMLSYLSMRGVHYKEELSDV
nr:ATP-binding cassette domain-containing protein [bacterium]